MAIKKFASIVLSLALSLGIFAGVMPVSAEEVTLSDAEIQELIERSKLDKGDKYDDNIFTFEIVNIATLNDTLTAAFSADKVAGTTTNLTTAINNMNTSGISVRLSIDQSQLAEGVSVTSYSSVMSEKNADLSLPYSVMLDNICVARPCNASNGYVYSNLKTGEVYTAEFTVKQTVNGVSENREYIGNFGIGFNEDCTLYCEATVIDVTDLKAEADARFATGQNLDNYLKPINAITDSSTVYLNVEKGKSKVFTFTATESGFVDTVLYSTEAMDAVITVKKISEGATYSEILARPDYVSAGSRRAEAVFNRFYANEGMTYAVVVEGTRDTGASVMGLITTVSPRWYPQWMAKSASGTMYWDNKNLNIASSNYDGEGIRAIFMNVTDQTSLEHCLNEACFMCGTTLIIANMGLSSKTALYDIRDLSLLTPEEYEDLREGVGSFAPTNLFADPYSSFLLLNDLNGNHYTFSSSGNYRYVYTTTNVDVYMNDYAEFLGEFKTNASVVSTNINNIASITEIEDRYDFLLSEIATALAQNPEGILLTVASNHAIVVKNVNGYPRVFDSGRIRTTADINYYYNVPLYTYFVSLQVRSMNTITKYRVFN